jgi:hypothetical protein
LSDQEVKDDFQELRRNLRLAALTAERDDRFWAGFTDDRVRRLGHYATLGEVPRLPRHRDALSTALEHATNNITDLWSHRGRDLLPGADIGALEQRISLTLPGLDLTVDWGVELPWE